MICRPKVGVLFAGVTEKNTRRGKISYHDCRVADHREADSLKCQERRARATLSRFLRTAAIRWTIFPCVSQVRKIESCSSNDTPTVMSFESEVRRVVNPLDLPFVRTICLLCGHQNCPERRRESLSILACCKCRVRAVERLKNLLARHDKDDRGK